MKIRWLVFVMMILIISIPLKSNANVISEYVPEYDDYVSFANQYYQYFLDGDIEMVKGVTIDRRFISDPNADVSLLSKHENKVSLIYSNYRFNPIVSYEVIPRKSFTMDNSVSFNVHINSTEGKTIVSQIRVAYQDGEFTVYSFELYGDCNVTQEFNKYYSDLYKNIDIAKYY